MLINYLLLFSTLCGPFGVAQDMLGVFAGDIPSFSCGSVEPKLTMVINRIRYQQRKTLN
jgi:hypothetical protein